ncbi:DUF308 domain-containing protein [Bradyrhizobium ganzhouense]|uniref:DUF308 domain-containing protein n=1 Tax=Bradyrhizobium ganzhouense TaxID=1179767 RepID=UPI003CEF51B3
MIAAGVLALSDVAFATIVSVKLIGIAAIAAGAFEIAHTLLTRGWGHCRRQGSKGLEPSCGSDLNIPSVSVQGFVG